MDFDALSYNQRMENSLEEIMYLGNESLDLRLTLLESAQCFHWKALEKGFAAVVEGVPVWLWREEDGLHTCDGADVQRLRRYLDLDRDYGAVAAEYAHIPVAKQAIELYPGLRILNQPPWEALVAFILSANNNVQRIRQLVERIGCALGPCFEVEGQPLWGFPEPQALVDCGEEGLRALGLGYRAPYLIETARSVLEGFPLDALCAMPYEQAHRALVALKGVGDKVADCVLLFGCGQSSAFPVDVWVERLLKGWFKMDGCNRRQMMQSARELLGAHGGLLQQFLFHAARMGDIEL